MKRSAEELAAALAGGDFVALAKFDPPTVAGLYAIKLAAGAWRGTVLEPEEDVGPKGIAYVGKGEGPGGVAQRWRDEHLALHSGRSSPRRSWLAILAPAWKIPIYPRPCLPNSTPNIQCYVSDRDGERRLREWIRDEYRVSAIRLEVDEIPVIASLETQVIQILRPYANKGTPHPLWNKVFVPGRKRLIAEAKSRLVAHDLLDLTHHQT